MKKKIISILLTVTMAGALVYTPVFADRDYDELGEVVEQEDTEEGLMEEQPTESIENVETDTENNAASNEAENNEDTIVKDDVENNDEEKSAEEDNLEVKEEQEESETTSNNSIEIIEDEDTEETISENDVEEIIKDKEIEQENTVSGNNNEAIEEDVGSTVSENGFAEEDGVSIVSEDIITEVEETEESFDNETVSDNDIRFLSEEADGHMITVSGNIPENAELYARKLSVAKSKEAESIVNEETDEIQSFTVYDAFDIEIRVDGETWQPVDDGEAVTVQITGIDISEMDEDSNIGVYRIEDDKDEATPLGGEILDDETVSFETEHFTIFTIGEVEYDTDDATNSWKCGENITLYWYEDEKTIILCGTGKTFDYSGANDEPGFDVEKHGIDRTEPEKIVFTEGITGIGDHALCELTNIREVSLPESLTFIGDGVFYNSNVTGNFVMPDGITHIGDNAFQESHFTGELILPEHLEEVGDYAFVGCGFSGELVIPNEVKSIGEAAFNGCEGFTGDFVIPDSVESIGNWAFSGCSIGEKLFIPDSLESIGEGVFAHCPNIVSITGGNGLQSIPQGEFLHEGTYPDPEILKTKLNTENEVLLNYDWESDNRRIVKEKTWDIGADTDMIVAAWNPVNNTLTISGNGAIKNYSETPFEEIKDEEEIIIAYNGRITHIGDYLFAGMDGIKEITIPSTVTSIGDYAYYGLNEATTITYRGYSVTTGRDAFTVTTAEPLSTILVSSCDEFRKQSLYNGWGAFNRSISSFSATWDISVSGNNAIIADWNSDNGILYIIGDGEMKDYGEGESPISDALSEYSFGVIFRGSPTNIGKNIFEKCNGAQFTAGMPDSVKKISASAFSGCDAMPGAEFPHEMYFKKSDGTWDYDKVYTNLSEIEDIDGTLYRLDENVTVTLPMSFEKDITGTEVNASIPVALEGIVTRNKVLTVSPFEMRNGTESVAVTISEGDLEHRNNSFGKNYDGYDGENDKATIGYSFVATKAGVWQGVMTVTLSDE